MTDDQKSFIKDMLKNEGWKIFEQINQEAIDGYRRFATQQNVTLEERLWHSAVAYGREESINNIKQLIQ